MSYPAPPPPGGSNPYQTPGATPNPYGTPYGGGVPPKKDNTLWWILGIIGVVIVVCCGGICGFFLIVGNEASDQISSAASSVNSSKNADAAQARVISVGSPATVDGAAIQGGWGVNSTDDGITGLSVRNDSGTRDSFYLTFYFMKDGDVLDDVTCNTSFLDNGQTDYSPTCIDAVWDIEDYDEVRVSEGF